MGEADDENASKNLADSFHCENDEAEVVKLCALHPAFKSFVNNDGNCVKDES